MSTAVSVNNMTVVHKSSDGLVSFMPDVCLTPTSGGPVPIPYPNIAKSSDADQTSESVTVDNNPIMLKGSVFSTSTGDEAGSNGGVSSGVTKGKAEFINYSFDVVVEGKQVPRLGDQMLGNKGSAPNTPPMAEVQPPAPGSATEAQGELEPDKIKVVVKNAAGEPQTDARYILKAPDGSKVEGKTDGSGQVLMDETVSGAGRIVFPDLKGFTMDREEAE